MSENYNHHVGIGPPVAHTRHCTAIRDLRQTLPNCDVVWDDTNQAAELTTDR